MKPKKKNLLKYLSVLPVLAVYFSVVATHIFFVPHPHIHSGRYTVNSVFKKQLANHSAIHLIDKSTIDNKKFYKDYKGSHLVFFKPQIFRSASSPLKITIGWYSRPYVPNNHYSYLSNCIIRV